MRERQPGVKKATRQRGNRQPGSRPAPPSCLGALVPSAPSPLGAAALREELRGFGRAARRWKTRSLRQFAEDEIVIPEGRFEGRRFRCDRLPHVRLFFDEIDSGRWRRVAFTGPTQAGKTLLLVIIYLYHLFELAETVIFGVASADMADDKWREEIEPVLERTRYNHLRPTRGSGSRGGRVTGAVKFRNGATLKFMSGGGGDAIISHFTARVSGATEADKLDLTAKRSREADKISRLEARTDSFGDQARFYFESTCSYSRGRIWREYKLGTKSRIACPCPHCEQYVTPEREHLLGWQGAGTLTAAEKLASFHCPACGEQISESERIKMNHRAVLLHREEGTEEGNEATRREEGNEATRQPGTKQAPGARPSLPRCLGASLPSSPLPETDTFSYRWNAFNNLLWTTGFIAGREWKAAQEPDEENAKKKLLQFTWALPYDPPSLDLSELDWHTLARRATKQPRGQVPLETAHLTVAIDLGQRWCNWVALAHAADGSPHVVDYNLLEVPSEGLGIERGLLAALREFRDLCTSGWPQARGGANWLPELVYIDAGNWAEIVYAFVRESGEPFCAVKGHGVSQAGAGQYRSRKSTGSDVLHVSPCGRYHVVWLPDSGVRLYELDADAWKSWLRARATTSPEQPGALTLYAGDAQFHRMFCQHLCAERPLEEYIAGRGAVIRWENTRRRPNHFLDAVYMAGAAGHLAGARLLDEQATPVEEEPEPRKRRGLTMPDGRAFLVTER